MQDKVPRETLELIDHVVILLLFLDADDEWHPDFLHTIHALFKLFPSAGMFGTGWRKIFYPKFICKNKWHMDVTVSDNDGAESFIVNDYFKKSLVAPICWVGSTAVRADVAREMNGFKIGEHMGGDRDFWGRIALKYNLAYSSKILGIYRTDSDKRENSRSDRKLQSPPFINEGQNFLKNKTNVDKEKNLMIKMYINSLYLNYFLKSIRAGKSKIIYNLLKENLIINKDISVYLLIISFYVTPIKITQFILKILSHNLFSKKNVFKYNVKVNTYKAKKI